MVSGPGAVDLEGTATPVLHALHLSQGVYQFRLTVTDSAGQSSSVDVTVDVLSGGEGRGGEGRGGEGEGRGGEGEEGGGLLTLIHMAK